MRGPAGCRFQRESLYGVISAVGGRAEIGTGRHPITHYKTDSRMNAVLSVGRAGRLNDYLRGLVAYFFSEAADCCAEGAAAAAFSTLTNLTSNTSVELPGIRPVLLGP